MEKRMGIKRQSDERKKLHDPEAELYVTPDELKVRCRRDGPCTPVPMYKSHPNDHVNPSLLSVRVCRP